MRLLCGCSALFAQEPVIDWGLPKLKLPAVAKKIKEEGKKAGITSSGEKSNFILAVK
jgi:hypothetical protein